MCVIIGSGNTLTLAGDRSANVNIYVTVNVTVNNACAASLLAGVMLTSGNGS